MCGTLQFGIRVPVSHQTNILVFYTLLCSKHLHRFNTLKAWYSSLLRVQMPIAWLCFVRWPPANWTTMIITGQPPHDALLVKRMTTWQPTQCYVVFVTFKANNTVRRRQYTRRPVVRDFVVIATTAFFSFRLPLACVARVHSTNMFRG